MALPNAQPRSRPRPPRDSHPTGVTPGYCLCGCGRKTNIVKYADASKGLSRGQPRRYVFGHEHKVVLDGMYENDVPSGCWNWLGAIDIHGYARVGGRLVFHEMYVRAHGAVPEGKQLDHLCRNRLCVNPDHLEPVAPRWNARRGSTTRLTVSDVIEIRKAVTRGESRTSVSRRYGVCAQHVGSIVSGKKWADLS